MNLLILICIFMAVVTSQPSNCDTKHHDSPQASSMWQLISRGSVDNLREVIEKDVCLAFLRTKDGRGPMFWAHEFGRDDMILFLESLGVDSDVIDSKGMSPQDLGALVGMKETMGGSTDDFKHFEEFNLDEQQMKESKLQEEEPQRKDEIPQEIVRDFMNVKLKMEALKSYMIFVQEDEDSIEVSDGIINGDEIIKAVVINEDEKEVIKMIKKKKKLVNSQFSFDSFDGENSVNGDLLLLCMIFDMPRAVETIVNHKRYKQKRSIFEFGNPHASVKGTSALYASIIGHIDMLDAIFGSGLDVDTKYTINGHAFTLFHGAYLSLNKKLCEYLINRGANIEMTFSKSKSIVEFSHDIDFKSYVLNLKDQMDRLLEDDDFDDDFDDDDNDDDISDEF